MRDQGLTPQSKPRTLAPSHSSSPSKHFCGCPHNENLRKYLQQSGSLLWSSRRSVPLLFSLLFGVLTEAWSSGSKGSPEDHQKMKEGYGHVRQEGKFRPQLCIRMRTFHHLFKIEQPVTPMPMLLASSERIFVVKAIYLCRNN